MERLLATVAKSVLTDSWRDLVNPKVSQGKTAVEKHGIKYHYDGKQQKDRTSCHRYQIQIQLGQGDIHPAIKEWTKKKGAVGPVLADMWVPVGGSKEDVEAALNLAHAKILTV